jgi:hypothetical protein
MHKMNGQSFIAQKSGLNARKGVNHYSAAESNIYWVRVLGRAGTGYVHLRVLRRPCGLNCSPEGRLAENCRRYSEYGKLPLLRHLRWFGPTGWSQQPNEDAAHKNPAFGVHRAFLLRFNG